MNIAPTVSVTGPSDGSSYNDGDVVTITVSASDSDGSIDSVEFFVDGTSVGVDATSPYDIDWTIGVGTFNITAVATDNDGASTTSKCSFYNWARSNCST